MPTVSSEKPQRDAGAPLTGATVGDRIRNAYMRAGLNRSQLQRAMDVSYTTIIAWEKNTKDIRGSNLQRLSDVTGFSVDAILGRSQVEQPPAYPALEEFLRSKKGAPYTDDELARLRAYRSSTGVPTTTTFYQYLAAIRSEDPFPEETARVNAEALESAKRRGLKPLGRKNGKGPK